MRTNWHSIPRSGNSAPQQRTLSRHPRPLRGFAPWRLCGEGNCTQLLKRSLFLLAWITACAVHAQPLTLDSAIARALRHDRVQQQLGDIDATAAMYDRDRATTWLPQLTLNAQSTIQNEQMGFTGSLPGLALPEVPLDFHRILLNFNQTLYDGNATRERRRLQVIDADRQRMEAEARTIELKAQMIQRYMSVLVCAEQLRLLDAKANTLEEQRARVHGAVAAGAALPSEEDLLRAELVSTMQERIRTEATERNMRADLALLTGVEADRDATLQRPQEVGNAAVDPTQRADIRAFDLRAQALDAQLGIGVAMRRPTLNVFGNAGVGDPGYNMLDPTMRPMLLAGIGLQWRILDWGQVKRQRSITELQRDMLVVERDRALRQVHMALSAQDEELHKYDRLLEKDGELIDLRASVTRARSEQLTLGTATAADYITELDKENAARLWLEIHQLQRLLAQRVRLNIAGQ